MRDRIRQVVNIVDWVNAQKIPALLYFLDAEKAFDHLEWGFLQQALCQMNFGQVFLQWIGMIYDKQSAKSLKKAMNHRLYLLLEE